MGIFCMVVQFHQFSTIIMAVSFIDGRNWDTERKRPTLVLIHTGSIGKCKSNYCTITAKMVKPRILEDGKDLSTIFIPMPILNVFYDKFCARKISMHLLQT
jgi:hypothetical protein